MSHLYLHDGGGPWREQDFDSSSSDESYVSDNYSSSSDDEGPDEGAPPQNREEPCRPSINTTVCNDRGDSSASTTSPTNNDRPPTPWRSSKAKQHIINELKDEESDIYLYIGRYSTTNWDSINFKKIHELYASKKYKASNFKTNVKRILTHLHLKTGPFKNEEDVVEPWYTSVNNVSTAYKLLFLLYMSPKKHRKINNMSGEQIWSSHPLFQQYDIEKFKNWNKSMIKLTSKRQDHLVEEEEAFRKDMLAIPISKKTSRNVPFWYNHAASELLEEDVRNDTSKRMKPKQLWESRDEYLDFPLSVFRKHIYQERSKQLAAPCWQHRRNQMAQKKKMEEAQKVEKEWHRIQWDGDMNNLVKEWGGCHLGAIEDGVRLV